MQADSDLPLSDASAQERVLRHARKEALWITVLSVAVFALTVVGGYLGGYRTHAPGSSSWGPPLGAYFGTLESWNRTPGSVETPFGWGVPDWIFWIVLIPWLGCMAVTVFFCWFVFSDDPLGEDSTPADQPDTTDPGAESIG